ncbi:hypothetical protein B0H14DRAFT_3573250 [Mycena olivaceomarginata]|nr:hypothetical protein B0H14DRAFT_3573250 [Mycena olivaceomarginata]
MHDCLKPAYIRTLPFPQQAEAQRALDGPYSVVTAFPDSRLAAAHFSLVAISRLLNSVLITVPIDAVELLWLRIWPWIQFVEFGHHTHPRDPHDPTESALCVSLILFFWSGPRNPAVLYPHVEGVATIFGRASQRIVLAVPPHVPPHVYEADLGRICADLAALFTHAPASIASQLLRDLVDGVGGSRSLALLIAFILTRICPHLDAPPTSTNIQNIGKIAQFLGATTFTGGPSDCVVYPGPR